MTKHKTSILEQLRLEHLEIRILDFEFGSQASGGRLITMKEPKDIASLIKELKNIVDEVGPENVYRPIYDHQSQFIIKGHVPIRKELLEAFSKADLKGKSVIDLGCNFGFFSFLVKRLGASRVLGVDLSPKIITGCNILKSIYRMSDVEFVVGNIENLDKTYDKFDIAMLVDYFGKHSIRKDKIKHLLNNLELLAQKEILLVIRPIYKIREELGLEPSELVRIYPEKYIEGDYFCLTRCVQDHLDSDWTMHPISELSAGYQKRLKLIQFLRKEA
jgi:predicted RNA methylase